MSKQSCLKKQKKNELTSFALTGDRSPTPPPSVVVNSLHYSTPDSDTTDITSKIEQNQTTTKITVDRLLTDTVVNK